MIFKAYHENNGEGHRDEVIVPDSAHGTNPASASFAGFKSVTVKSNERGEVDIDDLKRVVNENTAAIMLTNPNTLGIFEKILWKSVKSSIMLVVYYIMMVRI